METKNHVEGAVDLKKDETKRRDPFWLLSTDWQHNVVDTNDVPELYSRRAIFFFTFFGSIFFGGFLMFINMGRLKIKEGKFFVILFSIAYIAGILAVSSLIKNSSIISWILNLLVALALVNTIWGRYIGKGTLYKPRSINTPLIILLSLFILSTVLITIYLFNQANFIR